MLNNFSVPIESIDDEDFVRPLSYSIILKFGFNI